MQPARPFYLYWTVPLLSDIWRSPIRKEPITTGIITKAAMTFTCELSMITFGFACCCEYCWIPKSNPLHDIFLSVQVILGVCSWAIRSEPILISLYIQSAKRICWETWKSRLWKEQWMSVTFRDGISCSNNLISSGWKIRRPWKSRYPPQWPNSRPP